MRDAHQTAMDAASADRAKALSLIQETHHTAMADAETRQQLDEQYQAAMQQVSSNINDNHQQNLAATTAAMDIRHRPIYHGISF